MGDATLAINYLTRTQFDKLMDKKAKGFVTQVSRAIEQRVKESIQTNLYGGGPFFYPIRDGRVEKPLEHYREMYPDEDLIEAVDILTDTSKIGSGKSSFWYADVGLSQQHINEYAENAGRPYMGRYTDSRGHIIDAEDLLDILESGFVNDDAMREGVPLFDGVEADIMSEIPNYVVDYIIENDKGSISILATNGKF